MKVGDKVRLTDKGCEMLRDIFYRNVYELPPDDELKKLDGEVVDTNFFIKAVFPHGYSGMTKGFLYDEDELELVTES